MNEDELTGLGGHDALDDALEDALRAGEEGLSPVSLVVMDVDKLGRINETFGREMGDEALRRLSGLFKAHFEPRGQVFRDAADRFAAVLGGVSKEQAFLIAEKCRAVLTNFPETAKKLKNGKYTGAPIREELFCGDRRAALAKYGFSGQKPVLLVLGGGSGSKAVNQVLRAALFKLTETFDILHLCGRGNAVQSSVRGYVQREYEEDMPSAYAASDLALSRSGAGAAFELISLKKPTLFIPLENRRTRGDQAENADYFQTRGLAEVLHEKDMTPGSLVRSLSALLENTELKNALAACPIARGNAAVLDEIDKMMNADNIFRRK